jgi:NAD(P)-dependent dehydrogenase (short-subunit alcohol dehydrogenase family)
MSDDKIIVIAGASGGSGNLAARALARAGHTVYAGMRATGGRNAPQVAGEIARVIDAVNDRIRAEFYHRIGIAGLPPARASL